eukprot:scaffold2286_cov240-Pinguiococcus_pyrenoidosus.AAC.14
MRSPAGMWTAAVDCLGSSEIRLLVALGISATAACSGEVRLPLTKCYSCGARLTLSRSHSCAWRRRRARS